jgi:hypothetical protein
MPRGRIEGRVARPAEAREKKSSVVYRQRRASLGLDSKDSLGTMVRRLNSLALGSRNNSQIKAIKPQKPLKKTLKKMILPSLKNPSTHNLNDSTALIDDSQL